MNDSQQSAATFEQRALVGPGIAESNLRTRSASGSPRRRRRDGDATPALGEHCGLLEVMSDRNRVCSCSTVGRDGTPHEPDSANSAIRDAFEAGASVRNVAGEWGCTPQTVRNAAHRGGVLLAGTPGDPCGHSAESPKYPTPYGRGWLAGRLAAGDTLGAVAGDVGCSISAVRIAAVKLGFCSAGRPAKCDFRSSTAGRGSGRGMSPSSVRWPTSLVSSGRRKRRCTGQSTGSGCAAVQHISRAGRCLGCNRTGGCSPR